MKKLLVLFWSLGLCLCHPDAWAQQFVEKQESLFSNKLKNPGFEQGRIGHSTSTSWTTTTGFASPTALTRSVSAATGTLLSQDYANCSQYPVGTALAVMLEIQQTAGGTTEFCSVLGSNVQQCVDVGTTKALYQATMVSDGTNTCGYIYRTKSSTTATLTVDNGYLGRNPNVGTVAQATSLIKVTYGSGSSAAGWNVVNATGTVVFGDSSLYNDSNKKFTLSKPGRYEIYGNLNFSSLNAASAVGFYNEAGSHISPTSVVPAVSTDSGGRGVQVDIEVVSGSPQTVRLAGYVNGTTGSLTYGAVVIKYFPTASEQVLSLSTPSAPTITKLTSGSGTYTVPMGAKYLRVRMVGGGGGGGGGGTASVGNGGTGGNTTFGPSLLVANGGVGSSGTASPAGGSASISAPAYGTALSGSRGGVGSANHTATPWTQGGNGGVSVFGGASAGGIASGAPAAIANSGSGGGGGGGGNTSGNSGFAGGGAGGFIDAIIPGPLASSYSYAVGSGGTGGTAGTGGYAGGAGGSGYIEITEYYSTADMPLIKQSVVTPHQGVTTINKVTSISATYTPTMSDETIEAVTSASSYTINLPPAGDVLGKKYYIYTTSNNTFEVTIDPSGSETLCGRSTIKLNGYLDGVTIQAVTGGWAVLNGGCTRTESLVFNGGNYSTNCTSSPCTVSSASRRWYTSVTRGGTGAYILNLPSGVSQGHTICTCRSFSAGAGQNYCSSTGSAQQIATVASGGVQDSVVEVICHIAR